MLTLNQPLCDSSPFEPDYQDYPDWATDAERDCQAATVGTLIAAGIEADTDTDEAVTMLLMFVTSNRDISDVDADISDMLISAASHRVNVLQRLALDAWQVTQ